MLSNRLGTVNDFHWKFKPVLSYSKPHTFSTFFGEEKERKNAFDIIILHGKHLKSTSFLSSFLQWLRPLGHMFALI